MENKEELIKNVKEWIDCDNDIKKLQKEIKAKRKDKKELTNTLVNIEQ